MGPCAHWGKAVPSPKATLYTPGASKETEAVEDTVGGRAGKQGEILKKCVEALSDVKGCRQRVNEKLQMRALASQHAKVLVLSYFQCDCGE